MIGGMYLGELTRLVLSHAIDKQIIFATVDNALRPTIEKAIKSIQRKGKQVQIPQGQLSKIDEWLLHLIVVCVIITVK